MKYLLALSLTVFALLPIPPVHIAPQVLPAGDTCPEVAKTPNLSIYLCEPENAPRFLINSYGFMLPVE